MLQRSDVGHYLLQRGLVDATSLLDHPWWIEERRGRHGVFTLHGLPGAALVLKQAVSDAPADRAAIRREAAVYAAWRARDDAPLAELMPDCLDWDAQAGVLVLAAAGPPWCMVGDAEGDANTACATRLAQGLAVLHAQPIDDLPPSTCAASDLPWVLRLAHARPPAASRPPAVDGLLDWIAGRPGVCTALARLAASWRADVPIHGDIRAENCLLDDHRCRLIDWESCAPGDADWDHAALIASGLDQWLARTSGGSGWGPIDRAAASALQGLRATVAGFCAGRAGAAVATDTDRERVPGFAGARLLQLACERAWLECAQRPSQDIWRRVALAEQLLVQPRATAQALFAGAAL